MHSILLALLTTGIVHTGYASNEYIAPRATTSGPGFAGEKRADPTAKVTLGPQSGYFVSLVEHISDIVWFELSRYRPRMPQSRQVTNLPLCRQVIRPRMAST